MFGLLRARVIARSGYVEIVESLSYQVYIAFSVRIIEIVQAISNGVFECVRIIKECSGYKGVFWFIACSKVPVIHQLDRLYTGN